MWLIVETICMLSTEDSNHSYLCKQHNICCLLKIAIMVPSFGSTRKYAIYWRQQSWLLEEATHMLSVYGRKQPWLLVGKKCCLLKTPIMFTWKHNKNVIYWRQQSLLLVESISYLLDSNHGYCANKIMLSTEDSNNGYL